jgi:hypothetical protein
MKYNNEWLKETLSSLKVQNTETVSVTLTSQAGTVPLRYIRSINDTRFEWSTDGKISF